ncbi:MAG: ABC transporter ATP-binding protein [Armatimonadota bacterium]|nr:ABC transporter ATP-binding protein [Armatimonadota bacterium]MDR7443874.1 ABC transporter ATP-binding protein [Armatimonadota bacterium]MDR7571055.1 ABC transporter ATP-binding protein [Armatimonadota bacterium]MDR7615484.1 ABC transporter ATP-binding protein [Armatimonadota bacterium]
MALLEIRDLHVYYGQIHALKGISLRVEAGEIVTLIGANGAGKTTTLRTISGLLRPRSGSVWFAGEELSRLPAHEIVRRGVVQVPEGRRVFGQLTVLENLELGAFTRTDSQGVREDLERVLALFPRLRERLHQVAGTLSGGEQQMLAIARGLMARPRLLLMDEPSMGLAPMLVEQIFDAIREINQQGTTILLVEQNAFMALETAHRGYVLETGTMVLEGPSAELRENPEVKRAYLGG